MDSFTFTDALIVLAVIALIVGALANIWKRGTWGIVLMLTIPTIGYIAILYSYYVETGRPGITPFIVASWLYLFIVFFFGVKHVMQIGFFELKSFESYRSYIKENNVRGAFPQFILYLGPILFFFAVGALIMDIARRFI